MGLDGEAEVEHQLHGAGAACASGLNDGPALLDVGQLFEKVGVVHHLPLRVRAVGGQAGRQQAVDARGLPPGTASTQQGGHATWPRCEGDLMSAGYAATAEPVAAVTGADTRREELVRLSDRLLEAIAELNLAAYPVPPAQPMDGGRRTVELPAGLTEAVNHLLVEAVWTPLAAHHGRRPGGPLRRQRRLFGQNDEEDDEEDRPCGS